MQPGLFYKYRYEGRIGTGIPNVRSQVAGSGIRSEVWVLMKDKSHAVVKVNKTCL